MTLSGKRILLIIGGGIAAYKSLDLIRRLREAHGERIVGLKDSSGDMAYARSVAAIDPTFRVFSSTEAVLLEAREGPAGWRSVVATPAGGEIAFWQRKR